MKDHDDFKKENEVVVQGSGGKPGQPFYQGDTLRSKAVASFVELLGEGENLGLLDGMKSVYLNNTPLQNEDGTFNFKGITIEERKGTVDQPPLTTVPGSEAEILVSTEVTQALGPVTRTTSSNQLDAVRVRIQILSLYRTEDDGDVRTTTVSFRIEWRPSGGGPWILLNGDNIDIDGKTNSPYEVQFPIQLSGQGPWDIRVTRDTPDRDDGKIQDRFLWAGFTEVLNEKFTYPYCHVLGVKVDTELFGTGTPTRGYHVGGRIVQVPLNFDPETRTYSGFWNGQWKLACTDDPAWCYRDLLRNTRYGLGRRVPQLFIDDATLYTISQRCSARVPDGYGGEECRFSCNLVINTQKEAYDVLNDMSSIFFGMTYWSAGAVTLSHDAPTDMELIVTNSNVAGGEFVWTGTPLRTRANAVIVSYNDKDDLYRQAIEIEQVNHLIARYGYRPRQVTAFGCNSRGQAKRLARWILYSEQMDDATVTYRAGEDHGWIKPGSVIGVIDKDMDRVSYSGRAVSYSAATVVVDNSNNVAVGDTFLFANADGAMVSRTVQSVNQSTDTIVLTSGLPAGLPDNFVWAVQNANHTPTKMKVLGSRQVEEGVYEVTALKYADDKFNQIDNGLDFLSDPGAIGTKGPIKPPTNLVLSMYSKKVSGSSDQLWAMISWTSAVDTRVRLYRVQYRVDNGRWQFLQATESSMVEMRVERGRRYQFRVISVATEDRYSAWVYTANVVARLPRGPIDPVSEFEATGRLRSVFLSWVNPADPALKGVQLFAGPTENFSEATSIGEVAGSFFNHNTGDTVTRYYWAQTLSHNAEPNAASRIGPRAAAGNLTGAFDLDTTPPEVPTNLTLTTGLLPNGMAWVRAAWVSDPDDAVSFTIRYQIAGANTISAATNEQFHEVQVPRNVDVTVTVNALDAFSNRSLYTESQTIRSGRDDVAPAVPTGLRTLEGFSSIWLRWNLNTETDMSHYEIYVATNTTAPGVNTPATAIAQGNQFLLDGLTAPATRNFWIRAVDTSNNKSAWTARVSGTTVSVATVIERELAAATWASTIGFINYITSPELPTVHVGDTISWQNKLYTWNGTEYVSATAVTDVPFENITGSIGLDQLPDGLITAEKIAEGALTLATAAQDLLDEIYAQGTSADGAAAAASASASTAGTHADAAGQSAIAAAASASIATTQAGAASTSAAQSAQSRTDALGAASNAATSAGVAASVITTPRALLPSAPLPSLNMFGIGANGYTLSTTGITYGTDENGPYVARSVSAINHVISMMPMIRHQAGGIYRITVRMMATVETRPALYLQGFTSTNTFINNYAPGNNVSTPANTVQTYTFIVGPTAEGLVNTVPQSTMLVPGNQLRFGIRHGFSTSGEMRVYDFLIEDLSAVQASSLSASSAAASSTAAGASATTATTRAQEAATSAGTAGTRATEAATSAQTAETHSSAAATSASTAATSRDQAGNSASAAAESATQAAASSTAAGQSASAAETERLAAVTARGGAETARDSAVSSRDSAAGSASTATTAAGLATSARDTAQGHASAASTSAGNASSSATTAGQAATTATTQANTAVTNAGLASTKAGEAATSASNAAGSATAAQSYVSLAALATGSGMMRNPVFVNWPGAQPDNVTVTNGNGSFAKVTGKYGNAIRLVSTTNSLGAYISTTSAQRSGPVNVEKMLITVELERISGSLIGMAMDVGWVTSGGTTYAAVNMGPSLQNVAGIQTYQAVVTRPAGIVGTVTDMVIRLFSSNNIGGGVFGTCQVLVHKFDAAPIAADSYLDQQLNVKAQLDGFSSSSYVMRLKSGGATAGFEMVAANNPTGPASAIRMDADEILLNGTVRAPAIAAGAITVSKLAVGDISNMLPEGDFSEGGVNWSVEGGGTYQATDISHTSIAKYMLRLNRAAVSATNYSGTRSRKMKVTPGRDYHCGANIYSNGAHLSIFRVNWFDAQENSISQTNIASNENFGWGYYRDNVKAPDGAIFAEVALYIRNDSPTGAYIQMANAVFRPAAGGELLVNGSITATHLITSEAVLTNSAQIADAIIENAHITDLSAGKLIAGTAMASSITVDGRSLASLNGDYLFDDTTVSWNQLSGNGTWYRSNPTTLGVTGGNTLVFNPNGQQWMESSEMIPYDPNKLYRVTINIRRAGTGTGTFFLGLNGWNFDKSEWVNALGANSAGSQHFFPAAGNALQSGVPTAFTDYVCYFKGISDTVSGAGTIASPRTMRTGVRFVKPMAMFNYNLTSGGTLMVLNHAKIEVVGEEAGELVNAGSTLIEPGLVRISGSTTVADWRRGGDTTNIDGGRLSANTVQANSLEIGSRNITLTGIQFEHNRPGTNQVYWSSGAVRWINDAGTAASTAVSSGQATWTAGVMYIYWVKGATTLSVTTNVTTAMGANNVVLATYQGGKFLDPDYGRTVIDGSDLKTGTVTADRLNVNSLSAVSATIGILRTATSGERLEIHTDRIMVYDASNTLRVRMGSL